MLLDTFQYIVNVCRETETEYLCVLLFCTLKREYKRNEIYYKSCFFLHAAVFAVFRELETECDT